MNAPTTAARRGHGAATRRPAASPAIPRRVSGPVARPASQRPAAVPAAVPARRIAARPSGLARAAALPDHRLLERLLRGRLWIWFIALALGGIVAMQVSRLKLNTGISRAVQTSATLEMQNTSLQAGIARLSSHERIEREVTAIGMQIPEAGDLEHVRVRGSRDGVRAVERMAEPSDEARQALAAAGALSAQTVSNSLTGTPVPAGAAAPSTSTVASATAAPAPATSVGVTPAPAPAAAPGYSAPAGDGSPTAAPAVPATPVAAGVAGSPQG